MSHPNHRREEVAAKIMEIYPEIAAHDIVVDTRYDHEKHAWIVKLIKGRHELTTHLERKDADGCMEGIQCIYLGVQIAQLVKNFEAGA